VRAERTFDPDAVAVFDEEPGGERHDQATVAIE
jgi:hypothetical protein